MKESIKTINTESETAQIQNNYEVDYWSKKYGVSTEELKQSKNTFGIPGKIIEAHLKNKSFSF